VDTIAELAHSVGKRIGDLGAGIGHLAIPLAERGFEVTAVEPACSMLERLNTVADERGVAVCGVHAAAEALPLESHSLDTVLIADALHFIDTELAAREIARVLVPRGLLVVVTCELGATPFMREVARITEEATQRKPRPMATRSAQLAGVAKIPLSERLCFTDETTVTHAELERILGSISFIGPAMNPERTAAFRARVHALTDDDSVVWARQFTLQWGRRSRLPPSPPPRHLATRA
jgi:2-polyprenyl-3-methyl-5-hydroxy-6-metoxy-1,4-benzoquinol methylase